MSIDVKSKIQIYDNGQANYKVGELVFAEVSNVWGRKDLAKITIGNEAFFIKRSDLITALENAGNTNSNY